MHVNKHMYINGSRKRQFEIVNFLANDEPRVFRDLYTLYIGLKIDCIRTCVATTDKQQSCNKDLLL